MRIVKLAHTLNKQRCIISLGVGKPFFAACLERLEESLRAVKFEGDLLVWDKELPSGCPEHFEAPFAFKPHCFYIAKQLGYQEVLWMDSTCVALRSLKPVFSEIHKNGYIFFNNNYEQVLGQWISDEALQQNHLSRDQAMEIPELPCSVLGLDLNQPLAIAFLNQWHQVMADGVTARGTRSPIRDWEDYQAIFWNRNQRISADPRVKGHRCDQPAAGLVAHRLGMIPYADFLRDIHYPKRPVQRHTIILHHREFTETITSLHDIRKHIFLRQPFVETPRRIIRFIKAGVRRLWTLSKSTVGFSL